MSLTKFASLFLPVTAAALTLTSTPAFARQTKTVEVYYQSFHTYYSCSGAEDDLQSILTQLGAQNIQTSCDGGLHFGFVDLNATFTVADGADAGASWQTVHVKTDASCEFAKEALTDVLPSFATSSVQTNESCGLGPDQPFDASITIWK